MNEQIKVSKCCQHKVVDGKCSGCLNKSKEYRYEWVNNSWRLQR